MIEGELASDLRVGANCCGKTPHWYAINLAIADRIKWSKW
jgi:hypothetical protein